MANPFRRSLAGRTCLASSPDPIEVHLDLLIVRDGVAFKRSIQHRSKVYAIRILSSHPPSLIA
jgi:hypothetical protein